MSSLAPKANLNFTAEMWLKGSMIWIIFWTIIRNTLINILLSYNEYFIEIQMLKLIMAKIQEEHDFFY